MFMTLTPAVLHCLHLRDRHAAAPGGRAAGDAGHLGQEPGGGGEGDTGEARRRTAMAIKYSGQYPAPPPVVVLQQGWGLGG